jgi:hypothetical protein
MNAKVLQVAVILLISFAMLSWIRSNGVYDFDIRSVLPFFRGPHVTLYDFAGLALILLAVCGCARVRRAASDDARVDQSDTEPTWDIYPTESEREEGDADEGE